VDGEIEEIKAELDSIYVEAVRPTRTLGVENLIASELAQAVFAEPLSKIRHILEAYLMLSPEQRELLEIGEEEHKELLKIYKLCLDLQRIVWIKDPFSGGMKTAAIPWSCNPDEIQNYLNWLNNMSPLYITHNMENTEKYRKLNEIEIFYLASIRGELAAVSARQVQIRFIHYAMPKVLCIMRLLLEKIVTPETWWQSLQVISGKSKMEEGKPRAMLQREA